MKTPCFALGLALSAATLLGQQSTQPMPGMPGMDMPATPTPQPKPQVKPQPNRSPEPADPMPADMRGMQHDAHDPRAKAVGRSEQQSVQQQAGQLGHKPDDGSDADSLNLPLQSLQETEAPDLRTGGDRPAPELLREVVTREPMLLEQFLALAEKGNPTLAQAERDIERSHQQARQVALPPDPVLGYSGDHIRGGEYHGGEQGAFFSQDFVLGRKLALRRDIYRAEGRSNEFALEVQRARVRNDVASAFVDALAAQLSVVVRDRMLKVALDADTNSHELQRNGMVDAAAVLTAEIAAEQAKIDFANAQRDFLGSFGRLAALAGQSGLLPHPLQGGLVEPPQLDTSAIAHTSADESPLVKQAQANVEVAAARVRDAKRERVPDLKLTAGEWYSGEELRDGAKTGWESFAQAGVQIPLWNRNQGNIGAAQAELGRAQSDVARTQLWTLHRAQPIAQEYEQARFTAERYRTEMLPRARRAYDLQVMKYQQMAQVYPAVLSAQNLLFTLQLSYVQALQQEWHAAIALQNFTLMNGLDLPMTTGNDSTSMNRPTADNGN